MTAARRGTWGSTYTGRRYYPADPRPDDFDIRDIAHALQCRFGGHVRRFYSVAEHCVHVSRICYPADALWGLLHDASEAYLVDVPRPAKVEIGDGYTRLECAMMDAACAAFGLRLCPDLAGRMPVSVRLADEVMLATEARDLMPPEAVAEWRLDAAPHATLCVAKPMSPDEAEAAFLARYAELVCVGEVAA